MRSSWGLLLMTALGLIAAVTIACTSPLYSAIAMTAQVRDTFSANPASENLLIQSNAEQISAARLQAATQFRDHAIQSKLGSYFGSASLWISQPPF
jgi:putative ABC transport system permease protein